MAGENNHKDQINGNSVNVALEYTIRGGNQLIYVDGWLGFAVRSGNSGDEVALNVERATWQIEVPSSFNPSKGDIIYIDPTEVTGHTLNDAAFTTTATDNVKLGRLVEERDSNNIIRLIADLV